MAIAELFCALLGLLFEDVGQHDAGALISHGLGDAKSDPTCTAGDDDDTVLEITHGYPSCCSGCEAAPPSNRGDGRIVRAKDVHHRVPDGPRLVIFGLAGGHEIAGEGPAELLCEG